jgi:exonuclease III
MAKFLRLALWNVNGLIWHKEEIILFLKEQHIDILLISETHFTAESYIRIPNYRVYNTNHPGGTAHGGTAILIKHITNHYQLQKYEENHLQATFIK